MLLMQKSIHPHHGHGIKHLTLRSTWGSSLPSLSYRGGAYFTLTSQFPTRYRKRPLRGQAETLDWLQLHHQMLQRGFGDLLPSLAAAAVMRSRTSAGSLDLWLAVADWPVSKMLSGDAGVMIKLLPPLQTNLMFYEQQLETTV